MLSLLLGCGTDTGNPGIAANNPQNGMSSKYFADAVVSYTCDKLAACHPNLSAYQCRVGLYAVENLDNEFGLDPGQYPYWAAVLVAEYNGEIKPESSAAGACLREISALQCGDQRVIDAYQPALTKKFEEVSKLYDNVCSGVY